jgi:transposase
MLFRFESDLRVYLHRDAVDFRLSINGLSAMVEQALGLDPFAPAVYVFRNRRRDRIKLLGWDRNGFWLLLKRLEADRFRWPNEQAVATLTVEQLHWLLEGIDLSMMQRHPARSYRRAA